MVKIKNFTLEGETVTMVARIFEEDGKQKPCFSIFMKNEDANIGLTKEQLDKRIDLMREELNYIANNYDVYSMISDFLRDWEEEEHGDDQ